MVVAIVNRIKAMDRETFNTIIERFKNRRKLVDNIKGFMGIELFINEENLEILVVTKWESMEDMQAWLDSMEFKEAHKSRGTGSLNAESEGIVYKVISV